MEGKMTAIDLAELVDRQTVREHPDLKAEQPSETKECVTAGPNRLK